jgi:hypothetical protein
MNQLPRTSFAARFNALLAAAAVTLAMLSGIDSMALAQAATPLVAHAVSTQPA